MPAKHQAKLKLVYVLNQFRFIFRCISVGLGKYCPEGIGTLGKTRVSEKTKNIEVATRKIGKHLVEFLKLDSLND